MFKKSIELTEKHEKEMIFVFKIRLMVIQNYSMILITNEENKMI